MDTVINVLLYILIMVVCYLISGFIHELGHIIVVLMNGWQFFMLVIGPIGFRRNKEGKVVCYLEKEKGLWGGVGGTIPKNESSNNLKIWGKVLLGGPLASIIMGIVILPIGIFTGNLFMTVLGAMPLGMGAACMIPMKTSLFYTDGGRWIRLHKGGTEQTEEVALFKLTQAESVHGCLSSIEYNDIDPLIVSKDPHIKYYGHYYAYKYYREKNDIVNMAKEKQEMKNLKNQVAQLIIKDCKND